VPPNEEIFEFYLEKMGIRPGDKVLDIGCGFGRFFPILFKRKCEIYGIDISTAAIEQAKKEYANLCNTLKVAKAEHLPFKGNFFDKIICWAVFDALLQREALLEINRVLKVGGIALITGKNDNYHDDDNKALIAEINARKKRSSKLFYRFNSFVKKII
jgi:ubiquinone/menaquinone biosynthesis C-methylase UbiE